MKLQIILFRTTSFCSLLFIAVILGSEQNFTVPEDVGSFEACFRVFNPPDDQEVTFLIDLVVDTIEGTAGELLLHDLR